MRTDPPPPNAGDGLPSVDHNVPATVAIALRAAAPETVRRIAAEIQDQIAPYAGPEGSARHQIVFTAVETAVNHFLDVVERGPGQERDALDLIRKLSEAEAAEGHPIDALRFAHDLATRVAWQDMRRLGEEAGLDHATVSQLVDLVFVYTEQLIEQVVAGREESTTNEAQVARRHILTAMLSGQSPTQYASHLATAGWTPSSTIIVVTGTLNESAEASDAPVLGSDVLSGVNDHHLTVVTAPGPEIGVARALMAAPAIDHVAVSWALPLDDVRDAYRWTRRALVLADRGLIDGSRIIDCSKYRPLLWLHADPALSRHASEELLAPLMTVKGSQRILVAETLMLWLQARESAPVLARRMSVHPNTVRNRMLVLRGLYGDRLDDPTQTLALLSALEVALPEWRAQYVRPRKR